MPSEEVWRAVHADLTHKIGCSCKLEFSTKVSIGRHKWHGDGTCSIIVNPTVDFKVPAHLILHEAAHHVHNAYERMTPCRCFEWGHCGCWAIILCDLYRQTGTPLPEGTQFEKFAQMAGILHRSFQDVDTK